MNNSLIVHFRAFRLNSLIADKSAKRKWTAARKLYGRDSTR